MSQPLIQNYQLSGPIVAPSNSVLVDKNGTTGAFTSIKDAIDSITNASSLNPIAVFVAPGLYVEQPIVMKPYVKLIGWAGETHTLISAAVATQPLITGANASMVQGFTVNGATGVGGKGVYFVSATNDVAGTFRLSHVRFAANTISCHVLSSGFDTLFLGDNLYVVTIANETVTHLKFESTGTSNCIGIIYSSNIINLQGTGLSEALLHTGPYCYVTYNSLTAKAFGSNSVGDCVVAQDGAHVNVLAGSIDGFKNNIVTRNIGAAPVISIAVNLSANSTIRDLSVEHPGTTGSFSGIADKSKVFIDPASLLSATFSNSGTEGGTVYTGPLYMGPTYAAVTDVSTLLNEALPVGLLSGGNMTQGTNPLDINISAGYGYVSTSGTPISVKKITWTTQVFTLPDDKVNYVYIDTNGVVARSDTPPDLLTTILLGRVKTLGGIITFIGIMPNNAARLSSHLRSFAREAIGNVFKSGSAVVENVTPFHLDVGSGNYYYADINYLPSGGSNINFYPWTITGGVWTKNAVTNIVNHTQYNNPTTGMVALTAGYYTKHTLWVGGDGINEQYQLIIGQAEYQLLAQAQAAPLPPISSGFAEITTPIAAIIVQEGAANIIEFVDIRPRIGFQNPSTSAATIHGNLAGLSADDHLQYVLTNGSRVLTGDLNMGTHNITNVGTVDGVIVSAHESRHLPNGADPLTTAAPLVNLSLSSTNAVGTANSLARSDHSHALTGIQAQSTLLDNIAALTLVNGDLIIGTGAATVTRLAIGASNYVLSSNGTTSTWVDSNTLPIVSHVNSAVAVTSAAHTIISTEDYVGVNFAGAVALTLNTVNNKIVIIKDESFAAATPGNTITITPSTGLVEGQANITITVNGMSLTLVCRSGNWFVV